MLALVFELPIVLPLQPDSATLKRELSNLILCCLEQMDKKGTPLIERSQ